MRKIILSMILITILILSVFSIYLFPANTVLEAHVVPLKLDTGDTAWMLCATGLVLLMTPGLGFFYGGMVGKKNVISTVLQSFIAMVIVTVLWVVVGFALCFGPSVGGFIGDPSHNIFSRSKCYFSMGVSSNDSFYIVCFVSSEICYYYTCFNNRGFCRTRTFLGVYVIYGIIYTIRLCSIMPHDLAS